MRQISGTTGFYNAIYAAVSANFDTVFETQGGVALNDVTMRVIGDSGLGVGVTFDVTGHDIVAHFETGVSKVGDFEAALALDAAASALLKVKAAGTAGNTLNAPGDEEAKRTVTNGPTLVSFVGANNAIVKQLIIANGEAGGGATMFFAARDQIANAWGLPPLHPAIVIPVPGTHFVVWGSAASTKYQMITSTGGV